MELIEGGEEYEQREDEGQHDVCLRAFEDIDELGVVVRIEGVYHVGCRVVGPVLGYTWQDAACAPVHPSQQQTD